MIIRLSASTTKRIPFADPDIPAEIHPKSGDEIKDYRGTHREKTDIDKILTNGSGGNLHFLTYVGADTKKIVFDEFTKAIHGIKLENL